MYELITLLDHYSFLWIIDSDIILPSNLIQLLDVSNLNENYIYIYGARRYFINKTSSFNDFVLNCNETNIEPLYYYRNYFGWNPRIRSNNTQGMILNSTESTVSGSASIASVTWSPTRICVGNTRCSNPNSTSVRNIKPLSPSLIKMAVYASYEYISIY